MMPTMDRHNVVAERLEEYVFGQLSPEAARDVEEHVRTCAICASEVGQLTAVMEGLARSADPLAPPAALRARLQRAIAVEAQEPRRPDVATGDERDAIRRPVRSGWHAGWFAAAAVMMLGLVALLYVVDASRRAMAGEAERARAEAENLREELGRFSAQADLALSILTASDMREIPLAGRDDAAAANARAYWSPTHGLLVVADRLPAPPAGRVYQVWLIAGGQPTSAGLLTGEGVGRGMLIVPPPRASSGGPVTIAVTDEPPGGLPAPSGTIRLAGSV